MKDDNPLGIYDILDVGLISDIPFITVTSFSIRHPLYRRHICRNMLCRPCTHLLYPAEMIDLLKGLIIAVCVYAMTYIDTSMMYHIIKSQSVIKLYLFYNMLEVRINQIHYIFN